MSGEARPRSLRHRLARWVLLSTLITLSVFAGTLWFAFALEEAEEDDGDREEAPIEETGEQLAFALALAAPLAVAVAVGGALWLSKRALAPLDELIGGARSISSTALHRRLRVPHERDELHALTIELNRLFERLQTGFEALGRYAVDASHELRTPLAVVVSELDVALLRPRSAAEWEPIAERTRDELRRLTRLVESVLALAHAESPRERQRRFDLRERVDSLLANAADRAQSWGVGLSPSAEGGDDPVWVRGDPDAIEAAVQNVVSNALQYSPADGRVEVAVHRTDEWVDVLVDDDGAGVPEGEREAIFLPMRRGRERGTDRNADGHGLGLAIASRIVVHHGGDLFVEESPAGGARFVLRLPCDRSAFTDS